MIYGCHFTPIFKNSTPEPVGWVHQVSRRGACARRLRSSERRAEARAAVEIGDTTEEAVNDNETTPETVTETYPAENAETTKKTVFEICISLCLWRS